MTSLKQTSYFLNKIQRECFMKKGMDQFIIQMNRFLNEKTKGKGLFSKKDKFMN